MRVQGRERGGSESENVREVFSRWRARCLASVCEAEVFGD